MKSTIFSATAAFALLAGAAAAQDNYVSGQIGLRAVEDIEGSLSGGTIDLELDNALYFSGALGRKFGQWRFEAEIASRGGSFNALTINGVDVGATGNGLSAASLMANAIFDFRPEQQWTPYVGAGLGVAQVSANFAGVGGAIDGEETALALQIIGGISYDVTETATIFMDLRYFRVQETDYTLIAPLGTSPASLQFDGYTLGIGLSFSF